MLGQSNGLSPVPAQKMYIQQAKSAVRVSKGDRDFERDGSLGMESDDIERAYLKKATDQGNSRSRTVLSRGELMETPDINGNFTMPKSQTSTKVPGSIAEYNSLQFGLLAMSQN